MGKPHEIELLGKRFRFKSGYDEEYLQSLASQVGQRVKEVQDKGGVISTVDAALLAAFNISDDYQRLKDEHQRLVTQVNEKSRKLLSWIDSQL